MTGKFSTDRRNLLKLAGASPAFAIKGARGKEAQLIAVFVRPEEALTHSALVTWALGELERR